MISIDSVTPVRRLTGFPVSHRLFFVILLTGVLAACQSTRSALPDDELGEELEALKIIVSPLAEGSGDLDGQTVGGTVVVSTPAQPWMREVRFLVDDQQRHTATSAPFEYELDTTLLANGPHVLVVEARAANGLVRITERASFMVANDSDVTEPDESDPSEPEPSEPEPSEPEPSEPEPSEPEPSEPEPSEPEPSEPEPSEPDPGDGGRVSPSLRGDPLFDVALLPGDVALWYGRVWDEIEGGSFDAVAYAGRDCIYDYGRFLHTYVQSVLVAFRLTGDLALLDHVDEIAERMRAKLRDGWRGTLDGSDGTRDGYLNWVDRHNTGSYRGKDTHRVNDMKTHALVAMVAYALEANRDLESPGGRDYAAHADFWRDYLVNHFEAKWRERNGVPVGFPFMTRDGTHPYHSWVKWHYYMGLLTGDGAYMDEAHRMADNVWADLRRVDTVGGAAWVWPGRITNAGRGSEYLQRTTYARYVYGDVIEFHLEGFHRWASTSVMERYARTVAAFIIDNGDPLRNGLAADVGGGEPRGGLTSGDEQRFTASAYRVSSFPLIAAWDASGRIDRLNDEVFEAMGSRGAVSVAVASMLHASWSTGSSLASGRVP